jgi:hypothetical protein
MEKVIKGRSLGEEEIKLLLQLTSDDVNGPLLEDFFAFTKNKKPKFCPQDYFVLPAEKLYNKKAEPTTVGRYIFNLLILSENIGKLIGYQNKAFGKNINGLLGEIIDKFTEDKLDMQEVRDFLDKVNWFGFYCGKFINSSLSADFIITNPKVEKRKKELIKENDTAIKNGDLVVTSKIENELLNIAKEEYKDSPAMQIYDSGCRGSFDNNYKNTSIMRGAVKDFVTNESYISTSNLDEGIKPEEFKYYCDMSISGTYNKAVETQKGGYQNKIMTTSFQSSVLDEENSDCGTKLFYEFVLTEDIFNKFKFRYIKDPTTGQLVELNNENKSKYINKLVKMRSPLFCKGDKICNKCAGNYYYKMGSKNIGLLTTEIGGIILNSSMKAFHDSTVHLKKINIDDYISG